MVVFKCVFMYKRLQKWYMNVILCFSVLENKVYKIGILSFFLKYWIEFSGAAIWAWEFLSPFW